MRLWVLPPLQVIPVQRLFQAPSRLLAQQRAGQLLAGENLDAPANNLHIRMLLIYPRDESFGCNSLQGRHMLIYPRDASQLASRKSLQGKHMLIYPRDECVF